MSKLLNDLARVVELSKRCRDELDAGRTGAALRVLRLVGSVQQETLDYVRRESRSWELWSRLDRIHARVAAMLDGLDGVAPGELRHVLSAIIDLEDLELRRVVEAKEGLCANVLARVDPFIRDVIRELNKLSFVKQTEYSCSGHIPWHPTAYFWLSYDLPSPTRHNIESFHQALGKIVATAGYLEPDPENPRTFRLVKIDSVGSRQRVYYDVGDPPDIPTQSDYEHYERQLVKRWNAVFRIVQRYRDLDKLEHKQASRIPQSPARLHERMLECPSCEACFWAHDVPCRCPKCSSRLPLP